jgi:hypothetical protein
MVIAKRENGIDLIEAQDKLDERDFLECSRLINNINRLRRGLYKCLKNEDLKNFRLLDVLLMRLREVEADANRSAGFIDGYGAATQALEKIESDRD